MKKLLFLCILFLQVPFKAQEVTTPVRPTAPEAQLDQRMRLRIRQDITNPQAQEHAPLVETGPTDQEIEDELANHLIPAAPRDPAMRILAPETPQRQGLVFSPVHPDRPARIQTQRVQSNTRRIRARRELFPADDRPLEN